MGVDQSTTKTGVVIADGAKNTKPDIVHEVLVKPKAAWPVEQRSEYMWKHVLQLVEEYEPDLIAMEGYGLNMKKSVTSVVPLVELGGVMKYLFRLVPVPYIIPRPTELKMFATDNGGADKDKMIAFAAQQGYVTTSNDMADAFFLSHLGLAFKGCYGQLSSLQIGVLGQLKLY